MSVSAQLWLLTNVSSTVQARSSTYNVGVVQRIFPKHFSYHIQGNWIFNHNTGVYVGKFMGLIESSGHARGGKAPRHTTVDHAVIIYISLRELSPLASSSSSLWQWGDISGTVGVVDPDRVSFISFHSSSH